MSTFVLVHGAGGSGWDWHLVEAALRAGGHGTIAPDLPADDDSASLSDYADVLAGAVDDLDDDLIVVAHSFGAFAAPLLAERRPVSALVLVAGLVPAPGEPPSSWWTNTGHDRAVREQAAADGGVTGHDDPLVCYHHDVPTGLAAESLRRERAHPSTAAYTEPWPLRRWPEVSTSFVLCTEDRLLPARFLRNVVRDRLDARTHELRSGHFPALAHPRELARLLEGIASGSALE